MAATEFLEDANTCESGFDDTNWGIHSPRVSPVSNQHRSHASLLWEETSSVRQKFRWGFAQGEGEDACGSLFNRGEIIGEGPVLIFTFFFAAGKREVG